MTAASCKVGVRRMCLRAAIDIRPPDVSNCRYVSERPLCALLGCKAALFKPPKADIVVGNIYEAVICT